MRATPTMASGRLRPVPWGWLALSVAAWALLTHLMATAPADAGTGVVLARWAAFLLGLGGTILAAPETDPPRDLLRAAPVPLWGTLALRLAGWLALGTAAVAVLAVGLDGLAGWTTADLVRGALPNFLLVTAAGFLAAGRTSVLGGGAAALALVVGLDLAGRAWPARFPLQLSAVPGDPYWQDSRAFMVVGGLALVAVALWIERRTGARLGAPRRRRRSRPAPAPEAGTGP